MNRLGRFGVLAVGLVLHTAVTEELGAQKAPKLVKVDCSKGDSIRAAIPAGDEPVEIEIKGFCAEHVVISRAGVVLRGASGDPELDGITGLRPDGVAVDLGGDLALLQVEGVQTKGAKSPAVPPALPVYLEDLGVRDSPAMGIFVGEGALGMDNVRSTSHASIGVYFTSTSFGVLHRLHVGDNAGIGLRSNRQSLVNCGSCTASGNGNWAINATSGGQIALFDAGFGPSTLSGIRGASSWYGGRIWLSGGTEISASGWLALWAVQSGAIEVSGAAVDGAIWCGLGGELYVTELEQRSNNGMNNFYTECSAQFEEGEISFAGTTMFHAHATGTWFGGGALAFDDLVCQSGGDVVCYEPATTSSSSCGGCP